MGESGPTKPRIRPSLDPASVPPCCQILHRPVPASVHPPGAMGLVPAWPPRWLQGGKVGARSGCPGAAPHSL